MSWYKVTLDLDRDFPSGATPQITVARRVQEAYNVLGCPQGFAVYDLHDFKSKLVSFFFSPVAAPHFGEFIRSNSGEVWAKPLPAGAELTIGDGSVHPNT